MIDVNKTCVDPCEIDVTLITTCHLNSCKKIVNFLFVFPGITLSYQLILIYHDIIADGPDFEPYLHFSFKKLKFFTCWGGGRLSQKKTLKQTQTRQ